MVLKTPLTLTNSLHTLILEEQLITAIQHTAFIHHGVICWFFAPGFFLSWSPSFDTEDYLLSTKVTNVLSHALYCVILLGWAFPSLKKGKRCSRPQEHACSSVWWAKLQGQVWNFLREKPGCMTNTTGSRWAQYLVKFVYIVFKLV